VRIFLLLIAACAPGKPATLEAEAPAEDPRALRTVASFSSIADRGDRSRALFLESSRVFLHPRCANCHPSGDTPAQGMEMHRHDPPVVRGKDDGGVAGMRCIGCHQDHNLELAKVPGAPHWQLAPIQMAWVGKSPHAICEQMKDPVRNGHRSLAQVVDHNAHDKLVAWGWNPGHGRDPAPGTQEELGRIVQAWVETGAECPPEGAK
jgi:hypothetical protein